MTFGRTRLCEACGATCGLKNYCGGAGDDFYTGLTAAPNNMSRTLRLSLRLGRHPQLLHGCLRHFETQRISRSDDGLVRSFGDPDMLGLLPSLCHASRDLSEETVTVFLSNVTNYPHYLGRKLTHINTVHAQVPGLQDFAVSNSLLRNLHRHPLKDSRHRPTLRFENGYRMYTRRLDSTLWFCHI